MKLAPGLTFSWRRAVGVTAAKRRAGKAIGFPVTPTGRRAKVGRILGVK